jgi:RNA polymerase sigma factor (TIGR02999 family)
MIAPNEDVTALLVAWSRGDREAGERLVPLVYRELQRQAARLLRRERRDHTLSSTALVHEAYLRLVGGGTQWANRLHFFGVAGRVMRRVLVDHARKHGASKRGGRWARVSLEHAEGLAEADKSAVDFMALDSALEELGRLDPRKESLVELHFFAGLTLTEAAEALGVSEATATRDWRMARAWLRERLTAGSVARRPAGSLRPRRGKGGSRRG